MGEGCEGERRAHTVRQKGMITAKNIKHKTKWKKRTFRTVEKVIWYHAAIRIATYSESHEMRGGKAEELSGITCGSMGLCMLEDSDEEFPLE